MKYPLITDGDFRYIETDSSNPDTLILLHGLFGALSNFASIIEGFRDRYNVVVPMLPIYEMPILKVSVSGIADFVHRFVEHKDFKSINLLGNSLGGHVTLVYAIAHPERINSITLTGSSGLYESAFGTAFPRRGDYEFIKKKTEDTFYDPAVATPELIDEVFSTVNDRNKAIRVVATAKSAVRHNLAEKLHLIKAPTLLIWGKQDKVTPPFVGEKFHELIADSRLFFLDECGHAPMMEKPEAFNRILREFLEEVCKPA